jgi:hypothetical protein
MLGGIAVTSTSFKKSGTTGPVMTVTITAVPGAGAPDPAAMTEHTLQDTVISAQNSATSGMLQLANPSALASELFGNLRGYLERTQSLQRMMKSPHSSEADSVTQVSMLDESQPVRHGGPARENLEPGGADSEISSAPRTGAAELERVQELVLGQLESTLESTLITSGTSQVVRSVNTLLKGQ